MAVHAQVLVCYTRYVDLPLAAWHVSHGPVAKLQGVMQGRELDLNKNAVALKRGSSAH